MSFARLFLALLPLLVAARALAVTNELPVLRTIQEVRALTKEEAARGYPVHLQGVITYSAGERGLHFVADSTGGVYLNRVGPGFPRGTLVEIRGRSRAGATVPYIETAHDPTCSIVARGKGKLPSPFPIEPNQFAEIRYDAQLVKVEGRVEAVTGDGDGGFLTLAAGGITLRMIFPGVRGRSTVPTYLQGLRITATGVLGPATPLGKPQLLFAGSLHDVEIDPLELEERFSGAERVDARTWRRPNLNDPVRFSRAQGQVIYVEPRIGFFLFFGHEVPSLWVYSPHAADFEVGQHVEVVGRMDSSDRLRMRDAAVRLLPIQDNNLPAIQAYPANDPADDWYHLQGKLITVDLAVLSVQEGRLGEQNLILEGRKGLILGRVKQVPGKNWAPAVGSLVRVVGVSLLTGAEDFGLNSDTFFAQLFIRDPGHIQVLQEPPFWTDVRLRWLVWSVFGVSAFAFAWIITLRRRVRGQIAVISGQLERQAIHEERARLAREWHDTLQQQLVGVSIQVQAAAAQCKQAPELATQMLGRADAMLRHSQAEARRSVWNLRNEILEQRGLPEALKELRLNEPGRPAVNVRSSGDLSRRLPAETEFHLLRIAQEAVANALQHANARNIELVLQIEAGTVTLSIQDDGCGFDPAEAAASNGTHFGLLGMRERAGKIGAQLAIDAAVGKGTKTTVTLGNQTSSHSARVVRA